MSIKEIINMVIRIGVGSTLLIGGMVLLCLGPIKHWDWPEYAISGSIVMIVGLIAISLDIFKTLKQQKIDLQRLEREVERSRNFDTYKVLTEKRAKQDERLEELEQSEQPKESTEIKEVEHVNNN